MSYARVDELKTYLSVGEIVRLVGGAGESPDATSLGRKLASVDARIDNALANSGYAVPIVTPPQYLRDLAARLSLRSLFTENNAEAPDLIKDTMEEAESELARIANGNIQIAGLDHNGGVSVSSQPTRDWYGNF